jgi:hypothetical protein
MSHPLPCSVQQEEYPSNLECLVPAVNQEGDSEMVWAAISCHSVDPIISPHGQITAVEYMDVLGNQMHPMIQMFFSEQ